MSCIETMHSGGAALLHPVNSMDEVAQEAKTNTLPPQINVIVGPRRTSLARSSCRTKKPLHFDPLLHLIRGGEVEKTKVR
jgi:hypothetical protein